MAGAYFITHKDKQIYYMDFANSNAEEVISVIEKSKPEIAKQAPASVLGLVNVTGSPFNTAVADALKDYSAHNKPYMKMTAVVGVEGLKMVIYKAVLAFTGRKNLVLKNSVDEAKDWLAEQ